MQNTGSKNLKEKEKITTKSKKIEIYPVLRNPEIEKSLYLIRDDNSRVKSLVEEREESYTEYYLRIVQCIAFPFYRHQ